MKSRQEILNELLSFLEERVKINTNTNTTSNVTIIVPNSDMVKLKSYLAQLKLTFGEIGIIVCSINNTNLLSIQLKTFDDFNKKHSSTQNNENNNVTQEKTVASNINELFSFLDEQISNKIIAGSILQLDPQQYLFLTSSLEQLRIQIIDLGISLLEQIGNQEKYNVIINLKTYESFKQKNTNSNVRPETVSTNNVYFPPSFFSSNVNTNGSQGTSFIGNQAFIPYYPKGVTQNSGSIPVPLSLYYYYPPQFTQAQSDNNLYYGYSNLTLPAYEPLRSPQQSVSQDNTQNSSSSSHILHALSEPVSRKRKLEEETEPSNENTAEIATSKSVDLKNATPVDLPNCLIEGSNQEFANTEEHTNTVENNTESSSEGTNDVALSTFHGGLLAHSDWLEEEDVLKFLDIPSSPECGK